MPFFIHSVLVVPSYFCSTIKPTLTSKLAPLKSISASCLLLLSSSSTSSLIIAQPTSKLPSLDVASLIFKPFCIMSLSVNIFCVLSGKVHITFALKVLPDCLTNSLYSDDVFCNYDTSHFYKTTRYIRNSLGFINPKAVIC